MSLARRNFLKYSSAGLLGATLLNSCRNQESVVDRPNLIVLIADDLRWDCIGRLNNLIQTPNLDRLAERGIFFANNFVTTSICPTSRASIFTGLYARTHRIWDFDTALTRRQWRDTYFYLLQRANYTTAFIGKWGLGGRLPEKKFDYWNGFAGQGKYYTDTRSEHLTSYLTAQAEDFINSQQDNFCLTLCYKAPHADDDNSDNPFIPDTKFARQYQKIEIPRYQTEESARSLPKFLRNTEAQSRYEERFASEKLYQRSVKNYYRLISGIDESLGRIIRAVKQQNFTQDTYIIFTSDNGFFLGEKGLAGKWFGFEPAIRTPLIISSIHNSLPTKTVFDFSLNIDIAPTVLALAGVETPKQLFHGRNLLDTTQTARTWWFYEHLLDDRRIPANVGIRSLRYKYLYFPQYDYEMLFDLNLDPGENINLAFDDNYRKILKQYRALVHQSINNLD